MNEKLRIGALISGGGTNLQAIIDDCESGAIDGKLAFVGSDNPEAKGLARSRKHDIPHFVVDYGRIIRDYRKNPYETELPGDFDLADITAKQTLFSRDESPAKMETFLITRAIAEAGLLEAMSSYPFDLLVLAGFMRTLTPYFIDRVNRDGVKKIMNIHPALLPSFPGTDGYGDTLRYGCKVGGCTVHFIDYGEDTGPIIGQRAYAIDPDDSIDSIQKKGLQLEWELYPACIQLFARDRLRIETLSHRLPGGKQMQRTVVKILP
ncbi:MAG: phosphoribosylglycinamide formyltransferase [Deltaproteobacteria bacterium]|nr:phosphoribosylglycinamide formyltransferase [Deltaproteobacteria bacterium]